MSEFRFPPPPPPPPRTSTQTDGYSNQAPSRGRGRGRGRGDFDGERRGWQTSRGGHSGLQPHGSRTHAQNSHEFFRTPSTSQFHSHSPISSMKAATYDALPPGSYVNPAFNFGQQEVVPRTHALAIAEPKPHNQALRQESHASPGSSSSLSRTLAGQKRKLSALRDTRPFNRPGPAVAPSVPNFGAPVLPPKPIVSNASHNNLRPSGSVARSSNVLGLTPGDEDPQYSSSDHENDDDNVDEEAMYAELGTKLTFEHNGTVMSLSSPADLAQWRRERVKNFPTKDRMLAKLEAKRIAGEERKRILLEAAAALRSGKFIKDKKRQDLDQRAICDVQPAVQQAGKGEQKPSADIEQPIGDAEDTAVRLAETGAHSDKMNGDMILQDASGQHADLDSPNSSRSNHDEDPPEETSSKPSPKDSSKSQPICRYFASRGRCRDGEHCSYSHEISPAGPTQGQPQMQSHISRREPPKPPSTEAPSRKGIYQALIEQEEDDQNRLLLQAVKYLGRAGFFAAQE